MAFAKIGDKEIADAFYGANQVNQLYYGRNVVWQKDGTLVSAPFIFTTVQSVVALGNITPFAAGRDITIDWGGGVEDTYSSAIALDAATHTYSVSGLHTITIYDAKVTDPDVKLTSNNYLITGVLSWGQGFFGAFSYYKTFYGSRQLTTIPDSWEGLEYVTGLDETFNGVDLVAIPDSWDGLDRVTRMHTALGNNEDLASTPSSFKGLLSATEVSGMFLAVEDLVTGPTSWEGLDNCTDISYLFNSCSVLSQIPDSWDHLGAATNASYLYTSTDIRAIPDSWAGLDSLTDASFMFSNTPLAGLPSSWAGLETVEIIGYMFYQCPNICSLPTTGLSSLSNVTNCKNAFAYTNITGTVKPIYDQLVTTATSFSDCFLGCGASDLSLIPVAWGGTAV